MATNSRRDPHHFCCTQCAKQYIKSAVNLADWCELEKFKVPRKIGSMGLHKIHQLACKFIPDVSSEKALLKLLEENLPSGILQQALTLITKERNSRKVEAVQYVTSLQQNTALSLDCKENARHTTIPANMATPAGAPAVTAGPPVTSGNKRKYHPDEIVTFSINFQQEIKRARNEKIRQLELLQEALAEVCSQVRHGKILQDPIKSFAYKAGKVNDCVKKCHNGSIEAFLQANTTFTLSRFKCCYEINHSTSFDVHKL